MTFLEAIRYIKTHGGPIHNATINSETGGILIRVRRDDPRSYRIMVTSGEGGYDNIPEKVGWSEEDANYRDGQYATKITPDQMEEDNWHPFLPDPTDCWWELWGDGAREILQPATVWY